MVSLRSTAFADRPPYRLPGGPRLDIFAERESENQCSETTTLRLNTGTGFRIVNLFTEDHAAYRRTRNNIAGRSSTRALP